MLCANVAGRIGNRVSPAESAVSACIGSALCQEQETLVIPVSSIAYTPETYVVEYGTSQDCLVLTSDPTHSGEDITIANVTYSVTLSDLRENTNTAGGSTIIAVCRGLQPR